MDAFGGEEDTARGGWDARGERTTRRERGGRGLGFRSARDGPPSPAFGASVETARGRRLRVANPPSAFDHTRRRARRAPSKKATPRAGVRGALGRGRNVGTRREVFRDGCKTKRRVFFRGRVVSRASSGPPLVVFPFDRSPKKQPIPRADAFDHLHLIPSSPSMSYLAPGLPLGKSHRATNETP